MDKREAVEESCVDVARESLIEIAYQVPDTNLVVENSPKSIAGEEVADPVTHDGQEMYRSKLISISHSPSPDAKLVPISPVQPNGYHGY